MLKRATIWRARSGWDGAGALLREELVGSSSGVEGSEAQKERKDNRWRKDGGRASTARQQLR